MITYYTKSSCGEEDTSLSDNSKPEQPPIKAFVIPTDTIKKFAVGDSVEPILVPVDNVTFTLQLRTKGPFIVSFARTSRSHKQTLSFEGIQGKYEGEFFRKVWV